MGKLKQYRVLFVASMALYSFVSYLILLRDAFILERLSLTLSTPQIESVGVVVSQTLKVNYLSPMLLALVIGLSFYAFAGIIKYSQKETVDWKYILLVVAMVLVSFPALSTDVFDYNNTNRVAFIHQENPWQFSASAFPDDSEIYYGSWLERASVYPPASAINGSLVYVFFGTNPVVAIFGFKILAIIYYFLIGLVLLQLLPKTKKYLTLLFLLNPLILIEFVGNAHNDLLMAFFLVAGLFYLNKKKVVYSSTMMTLSILSKLSVALYFPIIFVALIHQLKLARLILWISLICLGTLIGLVLMGESFPYLLENIQAQFSIYQKSLPTVIRYFFIYSLGEGSLENASRIQKLITLPMYGLVVLYYLFRTKYVLYDLLVILMMWYLWIQAPMFQPWYLSWFLVMIPLVKRSRIKVTAIVYSVFALLSYPLYYVSLLFNPLSIIWQLLLALSVVLPSLVTLYGPKWWYTRLSTIYNQL
jgi:hypothetical protein